MLGNPALFTPALFLAQCTHRHKPTCAGFRQTGSPGGEVGTVPFRLFPPAPLCHANGMQERHRRGNQRISFH